MKQKIYGVVVAPLTYPDPYFPVPRLSLLSSGINHHHQRPHPKVRSSDFKRSFRPSFLPPRRT